MRIMRLVAAALAGVGFLAAAALPASAKLLIEIDKSTQRMTVSQDGARIYNWPVSSGVRAHDTPSGSFTPFRMEKDHFSKEWDDAPMPNSIFFTMRGHAIHGSSHRAAIGRPASHGCVRLEEENAAVLFSLVKREGMANTRVVLSGETPGAGVPMARRAPRQTPQQDQQLDQQQAQQFGYNPQRYDDGVTGSVQPPRAWNDARRGTDDYYYGEARRRRYEDDNRYGRPLLSPPFFMGPRDGY